jgi:hypothetical protein
MTRINWIEAPTAPEGKGTFATVYSIGDSEKYKDFCLARDAEGRIVITKDGEPVPGLEGQFTKYNLAKAAIDHFKRKSTIKDAVTVTPLS